jgi:hypothetical protein
MPGLSPQAQARDTVELRATENQREGHGAPLPRRWSIMLENPSRAGISIISD